jgi:hypothetical protein
MASQNNRFTAKGRASAIYQTGDKKAAEGVWTLWRRKKIILPLPRIEQWFISPPILHAVIKPLTVFQAT